MDFRKPSLSLAPMEGVTDFPTRLWFSLTSGIKQMTTPFLRVTDTFPQKDKIPFNWAPEIFDHEISQALNLKTSPQLMAINTQRFVEVAHNLMQYVNFVELNCGCPASKAVGKGAGSRLLADSANFSQLVSNISGSMDPYTFAIKMRTGYADSSSFQQLIDGISALPLAQITIHGRTASQKYKGKADWILIEKAAKQLSLKTIGSGDICNANSLVQRQQWAPSIYTFMIGRGALRNPWIFLDLNRREHTSLSPDTLIYSLACYALLLDFFLEKPLTLFKVIRAGLLLNKPLKNEGEWKGCFAILAHHYLDIKISPYSMELTRFSFGRLKLLWNYIRGSLPSPFMDPLLLRKKTSHDFFIALKDKTKATPFKLIWNHDMDWIYSGR